MIEIIGAALPRSGTMSLRAALGELGIAPCYHFDDISRRPQDVPVWAAARARTPDWRRLLAGRRGTMDAPMCFFWRELAEAYPRARVILTVRDPGSWYESLMSTVFIPMSNPDRYGPAAAALRMAYGYVVEGFMGGEPHDRARAIAAYEQYVSEVRAGVAPERLLVYDLADGWEPLCAFLQRPQPEAPFPARNTRAAFRGRIGLP